MLLSSTLVAIFALPALINGGQIPVIDGVIGGVPSPGAHNLKNLEGAVSASASTPLTPGKLRVVEKSGVCGGSFCLLPIPSIFTLSEETTPGVYQASGYGDLAANKSIWFVLHFEYFLCFYL
jgi:hypothetical protein